ncbi:bifunctional protein-serine/threonine kinase/phosphatase [Bowmanella dokdonensis]|uniref:Bifunctional protein-serine/threonine kinase/phosphatase n=1 Tax=Bowmanella dokdonensis TaxID=751969 RepID=A0A939DR37_9ALTE|nr:bifunctional protein-serine/threonine kinase/phosphatase [Bowmanella dokdonensis]MBN7827272.1 bifunctional protein-serine/threonine kinase/phosphatase [Bowmanella dokdonensis]
MQNQALQQPADLPVNEQGAVQLRIRVGGYSSAGRKPVNQDAFAASREPSQREALKGWVACIADGASCSDNAGLASQLSVSHFIADYFSTPDSWPVKTSAGKVLSALNNWLHHHDRQSQTPGDGLVTTFSALICKSRTAHLLHVGDSRIYRLRGHEVEQLTRDHCHRQLGGRSLLSRALGLDSRLEVDYLQQPLEEGDLFLLSTDGVHEFLPVTDLPGLLQGAGEDLEGAARTLVEQALNAGSQDNLTCLLIRVEQLPYLQLDEVYKSLTALIIPPVLEPGTKLDGFEVSKVLYSGPRSHLYLVTHPHWSEPLALKAPSSHFSEDPQYLEGFSREAWVGQRVRHASLMKMHGRPAASRFLYHLCEYIEGQTLRQWMRDHPAPSIQQVRAIFTELVGAVRALQRQGMVHRDLKPENVMLDSRGRLKLIDYGAVQVGGLQESFSPLDGSYPVGALDYLAPECLQGDPGSIHSDIYSLGVMLYELLTGHLPFKTPLLKWQTSHRHWQYQSARSRRADIPEWLDLTLQKATHPQPARRHAALSELLQDISLPNQSLFRGQAGKSLLERHPLRVWQMISALLLLVVLLQWALLSAT